MLLLLTNFGCQSKEVSNSSNKANAPAVNANAANQSNVAAASVPAPQTVKFVSAGNVEIVGTFYESPKAASPAVLMLHQWASNRGAFDQFARTMQAKGFGVLTIDGRGFGDSTKTEDGARVAPERTDEAVQGMKADVDNAFQFLAKQKNVDPARIGIVGASYGSSLAMIYGAQNKQVAAIALLSPGLDYFGNLSIEEAFKSYGDRPLLMVAADDDKESAETVRKLKASAPKANYETQIYPRGGHGTELFTTRVGVEILLDYFLTKNLQK